MVASSDRRTAQIKVVCGRLALVGLVIVSAVNLVAVARRTRPPALVASARIPDIVVAQERRFAPLRRLLENRGIRGVVGYISAESPAGAAGDAAVQDRYLAQYVLVPLILEPNFETCRWAVGNFPRSLGAPPLPAGWHVADDCGDGVLWLRKGAP